MKHEHKHFLARLVVSAFLLLGFGFWTSHFVVDAANWTIGSITRNNTNFLSGAFWDNSPTSGDIITALYGSGDEGSAYTQNWTGYTSGSCLSGGMNVVTTGVLPTILSANTIYVIASGTYIITTGITINTCSALISSGIVTLSGNVGGSGTIFASEKNNFIIEKIRINQVNNGNNGLMIQGGNNITIKDAQAYNNVGTTSAGLLLSGASYININNTQFYSNAHGIYIYNSTNVFGQNIQTRNNWGMGIQLLNSRSILFTGITSYENFNIGIFVNNSTLINMNNITGYNNDMHGLMISNSSGNTFNIVDVHDNSMRGVFLNSSNQNTLQNIVSIHNENGVSISNSTGNVLSGVTVYGNYYGGIDLYNTNYTTGNNITSNSSSGCLYLNNSSYNNFANITTINSPDNGVALFGSNNNTLSGLVSSGNMSGGVYMANSDSNTISNSTIGYNHRVGIVIETGNSNNIVHSTIIGNDRNGIFIIHGSGNTLDFSNISGNSRMGIGIVLSNNNIIKNSTVDNNYYGGITMDFCDANIISGTILSGNIAGIALHSVTNNSIINTRSYGGEGYSINTSSSSDNIFTLFSGDRGIYINSPLNNHFDTPTKLNHIEYHAYLYVTLTGSLTLGTAYYPDFDVLRITSWNLYNYILFSGVNSFTISGTTWDGIIYAPTAITAGTKKANLGETGISLFSQLYDTIEVVSGDTYLTMNGGTGTIDFYVSDGTSGQYLSILKSTDGTTWTPNTTQTGCVLNENKKCVFTTNGTLKLFAFGVPGLFFTGTTQAGTTVTSGGIYATGVRITFTGTNLSGATINGSAYTSGTLITSDGIKTFLLSDIGGNSTGITFTIDRTSPVITGNTPASGLNYTGGNIMTFTRTGTDTNLSGYTLYINSTGYAMGTATGYTTGLINGAYTRYVVGTDRAGNTGMSQLYPFVISTAFSGDISITGTTLIGSQRFTNSAIGIYMRANEPVTYTITGNVSNAPITGTINAQQGRMIHYPVLTGADGSKDIYVTITNASGVNISKTFLAQLDTVAPAPTLVSPTSGAVTVNSPTLSWAINTPDPAHISGYQYFVSPTPAFGTIVASGTTTATSATINLSSLGLLYTPLYRYVKAIDSLGNSGVSVIQPFYYSGTLDTTPDSFSFSNVTNARINRIYASTTVTITGLSANTAVLATASKGALYISGNFVGTTGYIQNGWTVKVELSSSPEYTTSVTSTVTIGDVSAAFRITTIDEEDETVADYSDISTSLSSTEKLQIIAIFEALRDLYNGDKKQEFFNSLMVMLESKIDDLGSSTNDKNKREALEYLYDLADQYGGGSTDNDSSDIDSTSWIKNGIYTAPNGKKYTIRYDSTKKQFTSTNFLTPKYFPTLDVLKYTIDLANPIGSQYASAKAIKARWGKIAIDGTWQTSPYTAPNRKVFYFFKTMEGKYSSYTFTVEKYFDSLDSVKEYIYNNNKK